MSESLAKATDMIATSKWTVETLRDYVLGLAAANDRRYTETLEAQQRAIEVAFAAQQKAIDTAFTAQKTGLNAALLAQKEAIATALVAAEKAVNAALVSSAQAIQKAETAAERRFESVNEFRATLADQQRMLMPRSEVEQIVKALNEKLDLSSRAIDQAVRTLSEKLDLFGRAESDRESRATGLSHGWTLAVAVVGLIVLVIAIIGFYRK